MAEEIKSEANGGLGDSSGSSGASTQEKEEKRSEWEKREISDKERRIRALTKIYYSRQDVLDALLKFGQSREVVPRYFEGFGKRPDSITYKSDISGMINKGATSIHCSEEIWQDPLKLSGEINQEEMNSLRKEWDLLIDIDCPFLDISKIAGIVVCETLERYGIKHIENCNIEKNP